MPTIDFEKLEWEDYPSTQTPLSADNLNRLEDAMEGIYDDVETQENTIANVLANLADPESAAVATKDYLPGELLVLGEYLYKTTATVLTDDALVEGTNIEKTTVADAISKDVLMSFASVEYTSTASKSYAVGSYIIYNNVLYVVTYLIVAGQTIVEGQNVEKASVSDMFSGINTSIQNIFGDFGSVEYTSTASKAYAVGDYLILNGTFYKVTASIAQGDTIIAGTNVTATTIDAELKSTTGAVASGVSYDNTESGLTANNVQDALDEVAGVSSASGVSYDNTESGLTADNVQDALDEVVTKGKYVTRITGSGTGTVSSTGGYCNVEVSYTPPANGTYIGESITVVGASVSTNHVTTFLKINETATASTFRVVSSVAQTITVTATRMYRLE